MPKELSRKDLNYRGTDCLNCNTPLDHIDKYCHQCGQLNTTKKLKIKDFLQEFFASIISYDSKLWRTVTQLLFQPGVVSRNYCSGQRASYANPFRFFLSISIVFFLLVQASLFINDNSIFIENNKIVKNNSSQILQANLDQIKKETLIQIGQNKDSLEQHTSSTKKQTSAVNTSADPVQKTTSKYRSQKELDQSHYLEKISIQLFEYIQFHEKTGVSNAHIALNQLHHTTDITNITRYNKAVEISNITKHPIKILGIVLPKIPLFLFFFAPIISLFFKLLYWRRSWTYMEHMVFNFHLLSFVFLCFYFIATESILIGSSFLAGIFVFIIGPLYLYKAMRHFYQQERLKTIIKFILINFAFVTLLIVSSSLFLIVSIITNL